MIEMKSVLLDIVRVKPSPSIEYVLRNGREFVFDKLNIEERRKLRIALRSFRPYSGWCHVNAARLWKSDHDFKYCEGYVSRREDEIPYPLYHSFNVLNGKLVDITPDINYHYFGVIFPDGITSKYIEQEKSLVIIEDYVHGFKFLKSVGFTGLK